MLVKVFIKRHIKEGKDREAFSLLKRLRLHAMDHQGYISSETLISTKDPQEVMVVSTWHDMEKWNNWEGSERRKATEAKLAEFLEGPSTYESFVFSKYRLSVQTGFPDVLG